MLIDRREFIQANSMALAAAGVGLGFSAEALDLLATHLEAPDLKRFYADLAKAESRHAALFHELACLYDDTEAVDERLSELEAAEADIVRALPIEPRIH